MTARNISHLALTVHIGERAGRGNVCRNFDFEIGRCHTDDDRPEGDEDEARLIGKARPLDPAEAAAELAAALDGLIRREFGVTILDALESGLANDD